MTSRMARRGVIAAALLGGLLCAVIPAPPASAATLPGTFTVQAGDASCASLPCDLLPHRPDIGLGTLGVFLSAVTMLLTLDVATRIGVSEQTVRNWCRSGVIPAVRPHNTRQWFIPEQEFTAWFDAGGNPARAFLQGYWDERTEDDVLAEDDPSGPECAATAPDQSRSRSV